MSGPTPLHQWRFMQAEHPEVRANGFRFPERPGLPFEDDEVSFAAFIVARLHLSENPPPNNVSTADIAALIAPRFPSAGIGNGAIILAAFDLGYLIYPDLDGSGTLALPKDAHVTR